MKKLHIFAITLVIGIGLSVYGIGTLSTAKAQETEPYDPKLAALGEAMFFDTNLSATGMQSCASCHEPLAGYTGPNSLVNASLAIYEGAIPRRFGNRKPPSAAYAGDSFELLFDPEKQEWFGGMFWDGRATGWTLHDPLAEQAQGPFLNPLEHGFANATFLCAKVKKAEYARLFEEIWGAGSLNCAKDVNGVYEKIGRSIAAYERSPEVNPFSSKFDLFWDNAKATNKDVTKIKCGAGGMGGGMGGMMGAGCMGGGTDPNRWTTYRNLGLSDAELRGLAIFNDPAHGDCAACHTLNAGPDGYPLFTNFSYSNIGMPKNPDNPFYAMPANWNPDGENWVDYGLGGYLKSAGYPPEVYEPQLGKFKVPTLRNVDLRFDGDFVKAYGHNGYFKSLEDIVFFYHWRAMMDTDCMGMGCTEMMLSMFPAPEVDQNRASMAAFPRGQVDFIVTFMKTLSDGYR